MSTKRKPKEQTVTCPHPKCKGKARKTCTLGSTDHYQCQTCGFSFADIGGKRS